MRTAKGAKAMTAKLDSAIERAEILISYVSKGGTLYALSAGDIESLLAEVAKIRRGWMPIESAPKDGSDFIGYGDYIAMIYYSEWWEGHKLVKGFKMSFTHDYAGKNYTHWQPLPQPPEKSDG
jgi:hypothetical protein